MSKTLQEYIEEAKKQTDTSRNRDIATINSSADAAIKSANDTYNKSVEDTVAAYEGEYERNAVQKLINEKQIAERNANLGLIDSGLNRTQQTAAQLSYANQKGNIDIAKRQALDKLSGDLAAYVTDINNQRESNKLSVNQLYDQQNNTMATEAYNADVNAAVEMQKAAIEDGSVNDNFARFTYSGRDDYGNSIFYKDGKKYTYERGVNPYTGTKNEDVKYGTFNNGYQPNNLGMYIDENGNEVVNTLTASGERDYVNGIEQTVWTDKQGQLWIWDGTLNRYRRYEG